jgi:hypothetical protein
MNTHELAWAAGLIDGEGHFRADLHSKSTTTLCPRLDISQVDRYVLDRFRDAVGRGRVYGPYRKTGGRVIHQYVVTEFEPVQAIAAMLWRWLSPIKRTQASKALRAAVAMARVAPGRPKSRALCKHGHERTEANMHTFVGRGGYTYRLCRACARERVARSRAKKLTVSALLEA